MQLLYLLLNIVYEYLDFSVFSFGDDQLHIQEAGGRVGGGFSPHPHNFSKFL